VKYGTKRFIYRIINKCETEDDRKSLLQVAVNLFQTEYGFFF
jgi:hypothetical protein